MLGFSLIMRMKTWLLLLFSISVMHYLVIDITSRSMYARINIWTCKEMLNKYKYVNVNDCSLKKILKVCSKDGINLKDHRFKFDYLKRNLRNFSCTQSFEYLREPKPLVALASFPGSGNTWTRELIETVTGVHSGSIYREWFFVGSKLCPSRGKVFVIRTHYPSNKTDHPDCLRLRVSYLNYSKAVFILRNPYNAFVAEFNRRYSSKTSPIKETSLADSRLFRNKQWNHFVQNQSFVWESMALFWLGMFERPVHVLVYERMTESTISEIYNLMKFINVSLPFHSLYCISSKRTGNFHRIKPAWITIRNLYDKTLSKIVDSAIENVIVKVGWRKNLTDVLHSYIQYSTWK